MGTGSRWWVLGEGDGSPCFRGAEREQLVCSGPGLNPRPQCPGLSRGHTLWPGRSPVMEPIPKAGGRFPAGQPGSRATAASGGPVRKRDQERILQTGWCPPAPSPVGCCAETLDQGHEPRTCSRGRCPGLSEPSGGCMALLGSVSPGDHVGDTHTHLQRKRARGWVGSEVHAATLPLRPGGGVASGPPAPAARFITVSWLYPHRGGWRDVRTLPHRRSLTAAQRVPAARAPAAGPGGDSGAVSPGPHSGPRWC